MQTCEHCGAQHNQTCEEAFHTLLFWELDGGLFAEHHRLGLCYQLQHPEQLSQEALAVAIESLGKLQAGMSVGDFRAQMQEQAKNRKHKIKATNHSIGSYDSPIAWRMTIADVVAAGIENYYESVRRWAQLTHEDILAGQ